MALRQEFARHGRVRLRVSILSYMLHHAMGLALVGGGLGCLWHGLLAGSGAHWTVTGIIFIALGVPAIIFMAQLLPFPGVRPAVEVDMQGVHVRPWRWSVPWSAIQSVSYQSIGRAGNRVVLNVYPDWYQAWASHQSAWRRTQATAGWMKRPKRPRLALPFELRGDEMPLVGWMNELRTALQRTHP